MIGLQKSDFKYAAYDGEPDYPWSVKAPAMILSGALVGPIGGCTLRMLSVDLPGFNDLKSTWIGALGGLVYSLVYCALEPVLPRAPRLDFNHTGSGFHCVGVDRTAPGRVNTRLDRGVVLGWAARSIL